MDHIHHAYLLIGERDAALEFLQNFWDERGVKLSGSPDYFPLISEVFGIDEARKLSDSASRKSFTGKKVFFIAPERITLEAQNALLKTFEDPYEETHFFLAVREEELILPTLRSRMQFLKVAGENESDDAKKFLASSYKERLTFAKKFADAEENLSAFLDRLLNHLREKNGSRELLKPVFEARRYSDDRAASARLILEHLALVL